MFELLAGVKHTGVRFDEQSEREIEDFEPALMIALTIALMIVLMKIFKILRKNSVVV